MVAFGAIVSSTDLVTVDAKPVLNNYIEIAGPVTTTSATLVDITGVTFQITTTISGRILAAMTLATTKTGGAAATIGAWAIRINGVDGTEIEAGYPNSANTGRGVAVQARSAVLTAGTYTIIGRHRRVAGTGTVSTNRTQLSACFVGS